jgi:hypothetical protein
MRVDRVGYDVDLTDYDGIFLQGDIHGSWYAHLKSIERSERLNLPHLHLGDINMGANAYDYLQDFDTRKVMCLRGNHEEHDLAIADAHFLSSYGVIRFKSWTAFYLSGAYSIDKSERESGVSWHHNEELTFLELMLATKLYASVKPDVIFSHEAPAGIPAQMGIKGMKFDIPFAINSPTSQALAIMHTLHKPKHHWFGHWHQNVIKPIDGCVFRCLDINQDASLECTVHTDNKGKEEKIFTFSA